MHALLLRLFATAAIGGAMSCGPTETLAVPDGGSIVLDEPLRCERDDDAPVPSGVAMPRATCVRVGAATTGPGTRWPVSPSGTTTQPPLRYVSPEATPDGDGSSPSSPMRSAARAIELLGPTGGTVLLSEGVHRIDGPLQITSSVVLVGLGAARSRLLARGADSVAIVGAGGRLSARFVSLEFDSQPSMGQATAGAVDLRAGASATLEEVAIVNAGVGVRVVGASLEALGLTIRDPSSNGIVVRDGGRAVVARLLLRGAGATGIYAERSHLFLRDSLVADGRGVGVALLRAGGMNAGASSCPYRPSTGEGGPLNCIERVAIHRNTSAGLYVDGMDERAVGPSVEARQISVSGNRVTRDREGGDGIYVANRAVLRVYAERESMQDMGRWSSIVANERVGVLVDQGATLRLVGASVSSNRGPGVLLQQNAVAEEIGYSVLHANRGLGIGANPGTRIDAITCNGITATQEMPLDTSLGDRRNVGDGISIAGLPTGTPVETTIRENVVNDSARHAVMIDGPVRTVFINNSGMNNRYGVQTENGATVPPDAAGQFGFLERAPARTGAAIVNLSRVP